MRPTTRLVPPGIILLASPMDQHRNIGMRARLSEMLDAAAIALLVMIAEDEMADGAVQARMNVVHEAGLFQGRLGFTKAIVLLEDGCVEFSNIQGLGQIRACPQLGDLFTRTDQNQTRNAVFYNAMRCYARVSESVVD